ncbi:UDP-2,3-diacylglucosamine diphosphatase [Rhodocyclus gracilis]|uniref:UDP-2,3-diacylglucosamine hydrolase n=1 Tax=Rhodocyclus tenuis TaxID=1066 RepID=A0A6L5JUZ6_RHOTE|nr:UDP-2,3-diacylglucosamine diphosphatase [Rhodocyclus gracilis]MQY51195.1 UDP-2,3-diacylglucosamine diphosphatase [Rhodocyclus gracilis]
MSILFISDLHLSAQTPAITRRFFAFLEGEARAAGELYILGDLFEAWLGDDAIDDPGEPLAANVLAALRAFTEAGGRLGILPGNRDFLLGDDFARRAGAALLADPTLLNTASGPLLLAHGDALCTADGDYQQFRRQVRDPVWRHAFLRRPLQERRALAAGLREQSETVKRDKSSELMDVTDTATIELLRAYSLPTLIHGHTHRPAMHTLSVDGQIVERWVLADWTAARGEYVRYDAGRLSRHALD